MANLKSEAISSEMNEPSICVDQFDIEQYINPENLTFPSPSMSPDPYSAKSSTIATPTNATQAFLAPPPEQEQTFSRPSHRYEQYKQQSSLPVGAVANTFALNESDGFSYGQDRDNMLTPTDGYFGMTNSTHNFVDFGTAPRQTDVDMDFSVSATQPIPALNSIFVQPSNVSGQETSSPQSTSSQPTRAWPGMHQQAAMQAKAQAEAQAQHQQEVRQQSIPRSRASSRSRSSASSHSHHDEADTYAEESIARLLDRMRHSSVGSSLNDDRDADGEYSQNARMKKDEEDMDDDERLLASEEGKKLSSKERRQLRNKVSARAFRSRRKEYIGQLEGELAAKSTEIDDLRAKNQRLTTENKQLIDLTNSFFTSPHFEGFCAEQSATGGLIPSLAQPLMFQQQQQSQQQEPARKDISTSQQQNNIHVGLATIPESSYELTAAGSVNNTWAPSITTGFDQQVYAVTSIPDEPIIDTKSLSGKSAIEPLSSFGSIKDEVPEIDIMPEVVPKDLLTITQPIVADEDTESDDSDPSFALFADQPLTSASTPLVQPDIDPEDHILGDIALEKVFSHLEIVIRDESPQTEQELGAATIEKFEWIRARMDSLGARVEALAGYM